MKILFTANTDWFVYHFRRALIRRLIERGDTVFVACPEGVYCGELERLGARWLGVVIDRRGLNPWRDLVSVRQHLAVIDAVRPDLIHNFTLKSVVASGLAASASQLPVAVVNSYDGLGYLFSSPSLKARLVRPIVRAVLCWLNGRRRTITVVLNTADQRLFAAANIAPVDRTEMIPGAGIDLDHFTVQEDLPARFTLLYASRLLYAKGVATTVAATSLLVARGRDVLLRIAGTPDAGNPDAIGDVELASWAKLAHVEMLGHRADIEHLIHKSSVVVLVSRYAEGLPTILAEAGACALPVITSVQGGCREIVSDGINGLVVPVDDPVALADAIERLIADPSLGRALGSAGRRIVEERFSIDTINDRFVALYDRLMDECA